MPNKYQLKVDREFGVNVDFRSRTPENVNLDVCYINSKNNMHVFKQFHDLFDIDNIVAPFVNEIPGISMYKNHKVKCYLVSGGYIERGRGDYWNYEKPLPNNRRWVVVVSVDSEDIWVFDVSERVEFLSVLDFTTTQQFWNSTKNKQHVTDTLLFDHGGDGAYSYLVMKRAAPELDLPQDPYEFYIDPNFYATVAAPMDIVINKWASGCYDGTTLWIHGGYERNGTVSDKLIVFPNVKGSPNSFYVINTGIYLVKHDMDYNEKNRTLYFAGGYLSDNTTVNRCVFIWSLDNTSYTTLKNSNNVTDQTTPVPTIGPIVRFYRGQTNQMLDIIGGQQPNNALINTRTRVTLNTALDYTAISSENTSASVGGALLSKCYESGQDVKTLSGAVYYGSGRTWNSGASNDHYTSSGKVGCIYFQHTSNSVTVMTQSAIYNPNTCSGRPILYILPSFVGTETQHIFTDRTSGNGDLAMSFLQTPQESGVPLKRWEDDAPLRSPLCRIAISQDNYVLIPRCYTSYQDQTYDGQTAWRSLYVDPKPFFLEYKQIVEKASLSNVISIFDPVNKQMQQQDTNIRSAYGQRVIVPTRDRYVTLGGSLVTNQARFQEEGFESYPLIDNTYEDINNTATNWIKAAYPNFQFDVYYTTKTDVYECLGSEILRISDGRQSIDQICQDNHFNYHYPVHIMRFYPPGSPQDFVMLRYLPVNVLNLEFQQNQNGQQVRWDLSKVCRPFIIDLRNLPGYSFTTNTYVVSYTDDYKYKVWGLHHEVQFFKIKT